MNDEIIKDLIKNADKTAFIIGLTYGSLAIILENLNTLVEYNPKKDLFELKDMLGKNIAEIYYSDLEMELPNFPKSSKCAHENIDMESSYRCEDCHEYVPMD